MTQLPLHLEHKAALSEFDFIITPANQQAVHHLFNWPHWHGSVLVLSGAEGCGKTHLMKPFGEKFKATHLELLPNISLEDSDIFILEDLDQKLVSPQAEECMFHLYNRIIEAKKYLLITARSHPALWPLKLPDLRTRLNTALVVDIDPPDDELLQGLIVKLFHDRQLSVSHDIVTYLVHHVERSYAAIHHVVQLLDEQALVQRRKITLAMVRNLKIN